MYNNLIKLIQGLELFFPSQLGKGLTIVIASIFFFTFCFAKQLKISSSPEVIWGTALYLYAWSIVIFIDTNFFCISVINKFQDNPQQLVDEVESLHRNVPLSSNSGLKHFHKLICIFLGDLPRQHHEVKFLLAQF